MLRFFLFLFYVPSTATNIIPIALLLLLLHPAGVEQQQLHWSSAMLSVARTYLTATSVGSVALFAGGTDSLSALNPNSRVDLFFAHNQTWATATLSQPRLYHAATSVADVALFGGGENVTAQQTAVVDIFNVTSGTWSTASLSQARSNLAATSVGSLALFAGGQYAGAFTQIDSDRVDVFNASSGQWTTTTLSQARSLLGAVTVGAVAVFVGGSANTQSVDYVDYFNGSSGQWTHGDNCPQISSFSATTVPDHFLALFSASAPNSNLYVLEQQFNGSFQWSTLPAPQSDGAIGMTSLGGEVALLAGGLSADSFSYSNAVYMFNGTLSKLERNLSEARELIASTSVSNLAFNFSLFAGGQNGNTSAQVDIISIQSAIQSSASFSPFVSSSPSVSSSSDIASHLPSTSARPTFLPITENISTTFGTALPAVNISAVFLASSGSASSSTNVGVGLSYDKITIGTLGQVLQLSPGMFSFSSSPLPFLPGASSLLVLALTQS